MGKKSSAKKPVVKKGPGPLATTFDCIICSGESKIRITFDKKSGRALLKCGDCSTSWSRDLKNGGREDPVDVYYDWVDEAEEIRLKEEQRAAREAARNVRQGTSASASKSRTTNTIGAPSRTLLSITPEFEDEDEEEDRRAPASGRGGESGAQKKRRHGGGGDDEEEDEEDEEEENDEEADDRAAAQKKRRLQSESEDED